MKYMWAFFLSAIFVMGCQAKTFRPDSTSFEEDVNAIYENTFDDNYRGLPTEDYANVLNSHFPKGNFLAFAEIDDEDLLKIKSSLTNFLLKTRNADGMTRLDTVYKEMERRKLMDAAALKTRHRLYVAQRRFDEARSLRARFPKVDFHLVPVIQNSKPFKHGDISVIEAASDRLIRKPLDVSQKTGVIMVGSTGCFFSRFAMEHISEDETLNRLFQEHSLGLMGSWDILSIPAVIEYNAGPAPVKLQYVWSETEWPQINYWGTPTFYFLKDGEVVYRHIGWLKEDRMQNLEKMRIGFELIGLR